jgi:hypothetical protein
MSGEDVKKRNRLKTETTQEELSLGGRIYVRLGKTRMILLGWSGGIPDVWCEGKGWRKGRKRLGRGSTLGTHYVLRPTTNGQRMRCQTRTDELQSTKLGYLRHSSCCSRKAAVSRKQELGGGEKAAAFGHDSCRPRSRRERSPPKTKKISRETIGRKKRMSSRDMEGKLRSSNKTRPPIVGLSCTRHIRLDYPVADKFSIKRVAKVEPMCYRPMNRDCQNAQCKSLQATPAYEPCMADMSLTPQ